MNAKQRVLGTLSHRTPVDFGRTPVTGIHVSCVAAPEQVREQVLRRCEVFGGQGGFVFNSIHNVQAGTPVENIVAMIHAVGEFNGVRHTAKVH